MSISWAITDKRYERQPWKRENFDGYFTEIRRAARKSLPRNPSKDLRGLLGLPITPGSLKTGAGNSEKSIAESVSNAPVSLKPVLNQTAERQPDIVPSKRTGFDKLQAVLLCRTSRTENCSRREKTVFGFSVYFAIIIFILLIIVLILSTSLSRLNDNNDSGSGNVHSITSSTNPARTSTSPTLLTLISSTKFATATAKLSTSVSRSSSSEATSNPVSSTKTSSVSNQGRNNSKTVTTTTEHVSVTRETSLRPSISITSAASSKSVSTDTSASSSETSSTKSVTSNTKTTLSPTTKSPISSVTSLSVTTGGELNTSIKITSPSSSSSSSTRVSDITNTTDQPLDTTTRNSSEPTLSPTTTEVTVDVDPVHFPKIGKQEVICTSSDCLAANNTLERVDFDKSPCVDFYDFACGRWSQLQQDKKGNVKNIPQSVQAELRQNLLQEIKGILQRPYREDESFSAKISKRLLQSCIESNEKTNQNIQEVQEIHAFVDRLGMTVDGNIPNTADEVLQGAVTRFELSPFFKMSTVMILNEEGINVHALKLEPTSVYLDYVIYDQPINRGEESFRYVEGLTQLLNSYISTLGSRRKRQAPEGSSNSTEEYGRIFDKVLRAYFIETNISKILENTTSVSDLLYTTLSYTYSNLKEVYPSIPWDAATGISRDVPVQLVNPDYFHALDNLWTNLDEEDMKLFVFMNVLVKRVLPYTTLSLRSLLSDIGAKGDMVYTDIDCVELSLNLANEEIHAIYIGQFTQKVLRNRLKLTDIKNKVSDAFQKYLSASTWIQPDLDRAVSALARNIKMHFSPLKSTVQQTMNVSGQSFLSLAIELHRQKHAFEINRLGSKATEITMDWTSAKVYFDAHFNAIGFPTGLTIYLTEGEPPFDIYGYIGMMMTEEFIKVLTGPLTGGIPPLWWGTTNTLAFNDVRQCFSSQLPTFQNKFYDIGNVMILNGAFQVIDQVYLTDSINTDRVIEGTSITENVIFILNVAQLHCQLNDGSYRQRLTRERINNVMMNNVNFKRMFSCPDPSPLVSDNTCSLFL